MCMIDDGDGYCIVLHERDQKARIEHRCSECSRTIRIGETYRAERTVFDGSAQSHKVCAHCMRVRDYLQKHCGGWMYTAIAEDMISHYWGNDTNDAKTRETRLLATGVKSHWTRRDGRLWPIPRPTPAPVAAPSAT